MTDAPSSDAPTPGSRATATENRAPGGRRPASAADVRRVYADEAATMARLRPVNRLVTGRFRRLFGGAEGRVLDVACGTGLNARYIPGAAEYVGVDLSPEMLARTAETLDGRGRAATLSEMDAEHLAFHADCFDTVVSSLSTCTFPDPMAALAEMNRVCDPEGRVLLVEHGRSTAGPVARSQDWWADAHYERHACRWTQDPAALVADSDLEPVEIDTALFGLVTTVEARPG